MIEDKEIIAIILSNLSDNNLRTNNKLNPSAFQEIARYSNWRSNLRDMNR